MWRTWRNDSLDDKTKAFANDIVSEDSFDIKTFIKDPRIAKECKDVLLQNFHYINTAYLDMMSRSPETFPEISMDCFLETIESIQSNADYKMLPRANMERLYNSTTKAEE